MREHSQRRSTFGGRIGVDGELIGHDANKDGAPTTVWEVGILGLVLDLGTISGWRQLKGPTTATPVNLSKNPASSLQILGPEFIYFVSVASFIFQ